MPITSSGKQTVNISISPWSIFAVVATILGLFALYQLWDIVLLVFVAMIFSSALHGWVQWLADRKIPKILGVLIIYAILLLFIAGIVALLAPPLVDEIQSLNNNFPLAFGRFTSNFSAFKELIHQAGIGDQISAWLQSLAAFFTQGVAFGAVTGFFGSLISIFVVLIMTLYMVVQDQGIKKAIQSVVPERYSDKVNAIIENVQDHVGLWLRAELILMAIIAMASYIGLLILGVHNALALALLAGLTEAIPTIGPTLGAIPAVFFALLQSPLKGLLVLILYIAIQQSESHVIVPQVMRKAVGLNPLVSIIALLIGAKTAGVLGAILAIPVATAIRVVIDDLFNARSTSVRTVVSS